MKVNELIAHVNLVTDEDFDADEVLSFINDGIAAVNVESKANFPYFDLSMGNTEHPLPDKWQRLLLVPYAAAKIKQNDSSQFEYMDFYSQFNGSLTLFKSDYKIPNDYKDASTILYTLDDISSSPWGW